MADRPTITLTGKSKEKYKFWIFDMDYEFKAQPAVYVVTKCENDSHTIIYIGETEDLSERFDNHHKADCFKKKGANRLCAKKVEGGEDARTEMETDLIDAYNPPCNG